MAKRLYFHFSDLTPNPVFPKNEVLNSQSPNTLRKLKDGLTGLHKTLQNFLLNLIASYLMEKETCRLKVLP